MMDSVIETLADAPLAGLMLVVTLGFLLGKLAWRGFSPGPAGGTLAVALVFGYLGLDMAALYGESTPQLSIGFFGFALFIYSVGFEAGPQFLSSLRGRAGWKFVAVGMTVVVCAVLLSLGLAWIFGFDESTAAGVLAGGMTSAPTFAAASEEASSPAHLSVAFALAYPIGLVGLVLLIQVLPRLMHSDLSAGTVSEDELVDSRGRTRIHRKGEPELTRAFEVTREGVIGVPLFRLNLTHRTGCFITRILRGVEVLIPDAQTELEPGDHLMVLGRLDELQKFEELVGPEVYDQELRDKLPAPRRVHVLSSDVHGRTLQDLDVIGRHRCMFQRIERGKEVLEPEADVALMRHDIVEVVGPRDAVRAVARELGRFEPRSDTTDIAIYAGGIVLGLLIGGVHIMPFGIDLSLGAAGGLLLSGVLLAWLRQVTPLGANVPRAARELVRDLGVLLFVGETGIVAGMALQAGLDVSVWRVLTAGLLVTVLPVLAALALGVRFFKLRAVDVWGSISGGMTSSAALNSIKRAADSNEPAVSYAAAYAVATIFVTVAGQVVIRVLV